MNMGFPPALVARLGCTRDGAPLAIDPDAERRAGDAAIQRGRLACTTCDASYPIEEGILCLLPADALQGESRHEQQLRDRYAQKLDAGTPWYDDDHNRMEMVPTLEALQLEPSAVLLELGCGDGRYTVPLEARARAVLAVDFSIESLRMARRRLAGRGNVGLVQADVATMRVAPAGFERVFSTLVSNLPTREHRDALYRLASNALAPGGRFVYSTHHHGLRQRLSGKSKSGRYHEGGIFRYNFSRQECRREVMQAFGAAHVRPISVYFPFTMRLGIPLLAQSRLCERIPLVNLLGNLLLCVATQPVAASRAG